MPKQQPTLLFRTAISVALAAFVGAPSAAMARKKALPGFADTHLHQYSGLSFGGNWLWGGHDGDPKQALRACSGKSTDGHGFGSGTEGGVGNLNVHDHSGWPKLSGWPRWNHISHQQMHSSWLKSAHDRGLNLMVMYAVSQDDFCKLIPKKLRKPGVSCEDWDSILLQLRAAKAFAKAHPWYRIAYSPADARRIISEGKLAVVLGVEAGNVFGKADWRRRLATLYDHGVRSMHIVHEVDNRFGGAAWHALALRILQTIHNFRDWKNKLKQFGQDLKNAVIGSGSIADKAKAGMKAFSSLANRMISFELDRNKLNVKGLTAEGKALIDEMIRRKMIIDISHLSHRSIKDTFEIAKRNAFYPLLDGHSHPRFSYAYTNTPVEWSYPSWVYAMVARTGGVVGLRPDAVHVRTYAGSGVRNDCPGSSKSFAQVYAFMTKELGINVAFAADFGGWARNVSPRFGRLSETCSEDGGRGSKRYARAQKMRLGTEFDVRGLAHIGLEPDLLQEMKKLGLDTSNVERSADNFVKMWERIHDTNRREIPYRVDLRAAERKLGPKVNPPSLWTKFGALARGVIQKVKGAAQALFAKAKQVANRLWRKAKRAVGKAFSTVRRSTSRFLGKARSLFKRTAKKANRSAKQLVGKAASFVKRAASTVKSKLKKAGKSIKKTARRALRSIKSFFRRW